MPVLDGLGATRELAATGATVRVLVLSMSDDDAQVLAAMRAGASGYLLKGAGPEEIATAIRAAAEGSAVFGSALAGRMLTLFRPEPGRGLGERFPELSAREREVLGHLADGLSNQQIARPAVHLADHGAQPRQQHPRQAPGAGPSAGDAAGPRARHAD